MTQKKTAMQSTNNMQSVISQLHGRLYTTKLNVLFINNYTAVSVLKILHNKREKYRQKKKQNNNKMKT